MFRKEEQMKFSKAPKTGDSSGGEFLKLKDGESVSGVFRGEPHEFYSRYNPNNNTSSLVEENDHGARFRFRLNFVTRDKETKDFKALIWEQGPTVYNLLKELNEEYGDLSTKVLKIKRKGEKLETEYVIIPDGKANFNDVVRKAVEQVPLHDLTLGLKEEEGQPPKASGDEDDSIPF